MKDLLPQELYCLKIDTSSMKNSAYPPPPSLPRQPPPFYGLPLHFYKKIFSYKHRKGSMIFQKSKPPINKGGGEVTLCQCLECQCFQKN